MFAINSTLIRVYSFRVHGRWSIPKWKIKSAQLRFCWLFNVFFCPKLRFSVGSYSQGTKNCSHISKHRLSSLPFRMQPKICVKKKTITQIMHHKWVSKWNKQIDTNVMCVCVVFVSFIFQLHRKKICIHKNVKNFI